MRTPADHMNIDKKLKLVLLSFVIFTLTAIYALQFIHKGATFNKLNSQHYKAAHDLDKYYHDLRNELTNFDSQDARFDPETLAAIHAETAFLRSLPQECLDRLSPADLWLLKKIGTYELYELCRYDIQVADNLLKTITSYNNGKLGNREFLKLFRQKTDLFFSNSNQFVAPLEKSVEYFYWIGMCILGFFAVGSFFVAQVFLAAYKNTMNALFNSSGTELMIIDAASRNVREVNRNLTRNTGYKAKDIVGHKPHFLFENATNIFLDISDKNTESSPERSGEAAFTQREEYIRRQNGSFYMARVTLRPITYQGRPAYLLMIEDITEQKENEKRMQMLQSMPEENPSPVMRIQENNKISYSNPEANELLAHWQFTETGIFPEEFQEVLETCWITGERKTIELIDDFGSYIFCFTPHIDQGYINIYGFDITEHYDMQKQLQEKEAHANHIFNNSPAMMVGLTVAGTVTFINPKVTEVTGYTEEEFVGQNYWKTLHPGQSFEQVKELLGTEFFKKQKQVSGYEMEIVTKYGEKRLIKWDTMNKYSNDGTLQEVYAFGLDVTDEREIENRLRIITDNVAAIICYVDNTGTYKYVNQHMADYLERNVEDIEGKNVTEVHSEENLGLLSDILGRTLGGEMVRLDHDLLLGTTGEYVHVFGVAQPDMDSHGNVRGIYVIAQDTTQQKKTLNELTAKNRYLELAESIAGMGHWQYDAIARTVHWSPEIYKIHGTSPEAYSPEIETAIAFYHPEDREHVADMLQRAIETGDKMEFEARLVRENKGDVVTVRSWGHPEKDETGTVTNIFGVMQDISAEKEKQVQDIERQKLEAIGQLAGGAAHEINNSLQPIILTVDLIKELKEYQESEKLGDMIKLIEKSAGNARDIVTDVLKFARKDDNKKEYLDAHKLINDTIKFTTEFLPSSIKIQTSGLLEGQRKELHNLQLYVNRTEFIQIFTNIVNNSNQAMDDKGVLTFDVNIRDVDPQKCAALDLEAGEYLNINITDTGCGMNETELRNMFEPFYTTKDVGSGTGLGMSTVYGIVKNVGGAVQAKSEVGEGTTIQIYLPFIRNEKAGDVKSDKPVNKSRTATTI